MPFLTRIEEQLSALKAKYPERGFDLISDPEIIKREYRKEFILPQLSQLIDKVECRPGRRDAKKYEDACMKILEWTVGQELGVPLVAHPRTLKIAGQSVKVRDITLSIPQDDDVIPQWKSLRAEHSLKSIVFECKNYVKKNQISRKEVFQLFEYLNPKTYGKLGIILSRYRNLSPSANAAIVRIAQDDYQIIVLGDDEIIEMINEYVENGSCIRFFIKQNEIARAQAG